MRVVGALAASAARANAGRLACCGAQRRCFMQAPSLGVGDEFRKNAASIISKLRNAVSPAAAKRLPSRSGGTLGEGSSPAAPSDPLVVAGLAVLNSARDAADTDDSAAAETSFEDLARALGIDDAVPKRVQSAIRDGEFGGDAVISNLKACGQMQRPNPARLAHSLGICAATVRESSFAAAAFRSAVAARQEEDGGERDVAVWTSHLLSQLNAGGKYEEAASEGKQLLLSWSPSEQPAPAAFVHTAFAQLKSRRIQDVLDTVNTARSSRAVSERQDFVRRLDGIEASARGQLKASEDIAESVGALPEGSSVWVMLDEVVSGTAATRRLMGRSGGMEKARRRALALLSAFAASEDCAGKKMSVFVGSGVSCEAVEGVEIVSASPAQETAEQALLSSVGQIGDVESFPAVVSNSGYLRRSLADVLDPESLGTDAGLAARYPAPILKSGHLCATLRKFTAPADDVETRPTNFEKRARAALAE